MEVGGTGMEDAWRKEVGERLFLFRGQSEENGRCIFRRGRQTIAFKKLKKGTR